MFSFFPLSFDQEMSKRKLDWRWQDQNLWDPFTKDNLLCKLCKRRFRLQVVRDTSNMLQQKDSVKLSFVDAIIVERPNYSRYVLVELAPPKLPQPTIKFHFIVTRHLSCFPFLSFCVFFVCLFCVNSPKLNTTLNVGLFPWSRHKFIGWVNFINWRSWPKQFNKTVQQEC
jgi:hypothetical protein